MSRLRIELFPLGWAIIDDTGSNVTGVHNTPTMWPFYFCKQDALDELSRRQKVAV